VGFGFTGGRRWLVSSYKGRHQTPKEGGRDYDGGVGSVVEGTRKSIHTVGKRR